MAMEDVLANESSNLCEMIFVSRHGEGACTQWATEQRLLCMAKRSLPERILVRPIEVLPAIGSHQTSWRLATLASVGLVAGLAVHVALVSLRNDVPRGGAHPIAA
jgi:CHASE1-domain containing sensor protein